MVDDQRIAENPLRHLKNQNASKDIRRPCRALTLEEANKLLAATIHGPKHHNLTGKERYLLYIMAIYTGFRAKELSSMTWRLLDLGEENPSASVRAGYTKNGNEVTLPLQRDVADLFRQYFSDGCFAKDDKVFPKFNKGKGAPMLKRDLEAVGIPYQDDAGRYADFHSLRHTFASVLDKAKLTLKERQTLLRHSTIALTMDVYTHIGLHDERQGIDKMPCLPSISGNQAEDSQAAMLKTGTDGLPVDTDKIAYKKLTKTAYFDRNRLSSNVSSEEQKQPHLDRTMRIVSP